MQVDRSWVPHKKDRVSLPPIEGKKKSKKQSKKVRHAELWEQICEQVKKLENTNSELQG